MSTGSSWAVHCKSARSTESLARQLAGMLVPGCVIALVGDLGAGKTTFVQGLARGLRVIDSTQVVSPTFALLNEYETEGAPLVHIDLYRLDDQEGARALGLEEQLYRGDAVIAVEWADRMPELFSPTTIWVRISEKGTGRRFSVHGLERPPGLRLPRASVEPAHARSK